MGWGTPFFNHIPTNSIIFLLATNQDILHGKNLLGSTKYNKLNWSRSHVWNEKIKENCCPEGHCEYAERMKSYPSRVSAYSYLRLTN